MPGAGIGKSIAKRLAGQGLNLVLVALQVGSLFHLHVDNTVAQV
jgi:short-subunit dehydrogenase